MRTLHVSQPVTGGTAAVVEQCAADDLAQGLDVAIASPPGPLEAWAAAHGVPWHRIDLDRQPGPQDLRAVAVLRTLIAPYDVVVLHSSKAGAVGRMALATLAKKRRPRCLFYPHAWSWYVGGTMAPVYRQLERTLARWTDAIVVVSHLEARDGRAVLAGRHHDLIRVIENGVDLERFTPDGPHADRHAAPLLVCVGRLSEQKGQDVLVECVAAMADLEVELLLVGDGPDQGRLESQILSDGLKDRVTLLSARDPRPYYRAADVVVLPSRWEGLSLVLLEAMACGAPIVATTQASAGLDERAGVAVSGDLNARTLEHVLRAVVTDPVRRVEAGRAARATIEARYSLPRVSAEYRAVLHDVAVSSPTASAAHE